MDQNELLRQIIDNNPTLTLIIDHDGRILTANKAFYEFVGHDRLNFRNDLLGNVVKCIHAIESNGNCGKTPDCGGCVVRTSMNDTIQTQKSIWKREGHFNIIDANSIKQLTLKVSTTTIEYEATPGILMYIDDITTEKRHIKEIEDAKEQYQAQSKELSKLLATLNEANQRLKESEARYRTIADYTYSWEVFRDEKFRLIYCSPGVERILGYSVEEYTKGISPEQIFHPDDLEVALDSFKRALEAETIHSCIVRMVKKNKEIIWVDVSAQPVIKENGEFIGYRSSIRDITKQKETKLELIENRKLLNLVFHYSSEWELYRNKNQKIIYCSEAIERIIGYTPEEYISGKVTVHEIIHPEDYATVLPVYQRMLGGEPAETLILRYIHKDGHIVWVDVSSRPVISESGELLGVRFSAKDISKLKETEFALKESEARYKMISDYSLTWEIYRRIDGKLIYCSPSVENVIGYTAEEYYNGIPFGEIVHPDYLDSFINIMNRYIKGEYISSAIFRVIKKNKETVWIDLSACPVLSEKGEILGIRISIRDITKQKEAELALEESEARYKLISDYSYAWETYRKSDGKLIYCSPAVERILGYTSEEYIQSESIFRIIYPEDNSLFKSAFQRILAGETIDSVILRHIKKNGEIIWADISAQPVHSETGEFLGSRISIRDITKLKETEFALKESEARYKLISDYSNDWEVYRDKTGKLLYCSPTVEKILGYTVEEFMQELPFSQYIHPDDIARAEVKTQKLINRETLLGDTYRFIKKNGDIIYMELHSQSVITDDGVYHGFRISGRDVTEKTIMEQELRELNATKDKFFSIISHDLKSPFNALIGFSDLLLECQAELTTEEMTEFITNINTTAKNAYELVEELLTWARSQSGKITPNQHKINLRRLTDQVIGVLQQAASNKAISVVNLVDINLHIFADKDMLHTIIRNLVANAIKYTRENGTVTISTILRNEFAEISVSDTGVGMDEKTLKSLFKIDETQSNPGTSNEQGTGLGLILCKEFVEKQGGEIWVESELGKGSKLFLTLPLSKYEN